MYFFSQNSFFVINLFLFYFEEKHIFFNQKHDLSYPNLLWSVKKFLNKKKKLIFQLSLYEYMKK